MRSLLLMLLPACALGCSSITGSPDASSPEDSGEDGSSAVGGGAGGGTGDAGSSDAGSATDGGSTPDAGRTPIVIGVGSWGLRGWTTNDTTWSWCGLPTQANDHTPELLRNIGFGDGVFIAVGGDANSQVMRSLDGVHWQENLHPTTSCGGEAYPPSCTNWQGGVAYGNGVWLSGGGNGALMRSTDRGLTWTGLHPTPGIGPTRDLAFGGGRFVAGTDNNLATTADDGANWSRFPVTMGTSISFGGGRFFAAGQRWNGAGFDRICFTSADLGATWTACPAAAANAENFAHDGSRWAARVDSGYLTSPDGLTWQLTPSTTFPSTFAWDGSRWVGFRGTAFFTSSDLTTWTQRASGVTGFRAFATGFVEGANLAGPACVDSR